MALLSVICDNLTKNTEEITDRDKKKQTYIDNKLTLCNWINWTSHSSRLTLISGVPLITMIDAFEPFQIHGVDPSMTRCDPFIPVLFHHINLGLPGDVIQAIYDHYCKLTVNDPLYLSNLIFESSTHTGQDLEHSLPPQLK